MSEQTQCHSTLCERAAVHHPPPPPPQPRICCAPLVHTAETSQARVGLVLDDRGLAGLQRSREGGPEAGRHHVIDSYSGRSAGLVGGSSLRTANQLAEHRKLDAAGRLPAEAPQSRHFCLRRYQIRSRQNRFYSSR